MPEKPTSPYGYIAFAADGSVKKEMFQLSSGKEAQESGALKTFVAGFNRLGGEQISDLEPLPECGHDAKARVAGRCVTLQLTELVDREFTFQISREEYDADRFQHFIAKAHGEIPWRLDIEKKNQALADLIQKKIDKYYAPEPELWLVVFTVCPMYETEYAEAGVVKISEALRRAREVVSTARSCPFSEVWFTDLITRPVRVWPVKQEA